MRKITHLWIANSVADAIMKERLFAIEHLKLTIGSWHWQGGLAAASDNRKGLILTLSELACFMSEKRSTRPSGGQGVEGFAQKVGSTFSVRDFVRWHHPLDIFTDDLQH